jgi:hypothetical protein
MFPALPLVPDNLKDRKAVFGFCFDDAVQRNYYDKMGLEGVVTEEDYVDIDEKTFILRDASQMAQCGAGILRLRTTTPLLALALTNLHIISTASPLSMH